MSLRAPGITSSRESIVTRGGAVRALRRALPSAAPAVPARRRGSPGLSMTSMIDVMVVLVVFLLLTFSASAPASTRDTTKLPISGSSLDLVDAPLVDVAPEGIYVDGQLVARREQGEVRLDDLTAALARKRALAVQLSGGRPAPEHVILAIDADAPSGLVKRVTAAAAKAGYPSIDFMVQRGR